MTKLAGLELAMFVNSQRGSHISDIGVRAGYDRGDGEASLEFYNELVQARREAANATR